MNDSIEINNSKVFNKSLDRINSFDLKGEERLIKRFNVNLGTNSVMVFFGTNEKFETSYFTDLC